MMFGTPQVIAKLDRYRKLRYSTSYGLPMAFQKQSLRVLIDEVMPAFA